MTVYSIYKITNKVNEKNYIGFTSNPNRRWSQHKYDSKNRESNSILYKAMNKYGIDNFEFNIIYCSKDKDYTINVMEQHFIDMYNSKSHGYNISDGGSVGRIGLKHSPETIELFKKQRQNTPKGELSPLWGLKRSEETKQKLRKPRPSNSGENNHNIKIRKTYLITFKDGTEKIIVGLNLFARLNNYNHKILSNINIGTAKSHKDITGVKQIDHQ